MKMNFKVATIIATLAATLAAASPVLDIHIHQDTSPARSGLNQLAPDACWLACFEEKPDCPQGLVSCWTPFPPLAPWFAMGYRAEWVFKPGCPRTKKATSDQSWRRQLSHKFSTDWWIPSTQKKRANAGPAAQSPKKATTPPNRPGPRSAGWPASKKSPNVLMDW